MPSMARAVYSWIPLQERGLVQGLSFSGMRFGADRHHAAVGMDDFGYGLAALVSAADGNRLRLDGHLVRVVS